MAFYATTFPEQRLETIRVLGCTMQCQVAHDVWTHRDAGVLPADAGSNCPCAASAARICRETFDQNFSLLRRRNSGVESDPMSRGLDFLDDDGAGGKLFG